MSLRCLAVILVALSGASGFSTYQQSIPNGDNVPHPCKPNFRWVGVGHEAAGGDGVRNPFGTAFENSNHNWLAICGTDSDGDGRTNGQELGDPNCRWSVGDTPEILIGITHPGVCEPMDDPLCAGRNDWVDCSYDKFECAVLNETETRNKTIMYPRFKLPAQETTQMCMPFVVPSDKAYHLVAVTPELDNVPVVHHILIIGCDINTLDMSQDTAGECGTMAAGCQSTIAAWAVGTTGMCVNPKVGYAFGAQGFTAVLLQIHYNNPMLRDYYWDASGVTLYFTPVLRQYDAQLLALTQNYINIPPGQNSVPVTALCSRDCTQTMFSEPIYIISAAHHMHSLGISAKTEHFRNNTKIGEIATDPFFSYDSPPEHTYDPPIMVLPGDELLTTCKYKSTSRSTVTRGDEGGSSDEMCILFAVYYPNITRIADSIWCGQYKSVDICKMFNPEFQGPVRGCQAPGRYFNPEDPELKAITDEVIGTCPFNECTKTCAEVIQKTKEMTCFRGELGEFIIYVNEFLTGGKRFSDAMKICDKVSAAAALHGFSMLLTLLMIAFNMIP